MENFKAVVYLVINCLYILETVVLGAGHTVICFLFNALRYC